MVDKKIAEAVSIHVLKNILQLLHPFIPHVTEEIWSFLNSEKDNLLINHGLADSNKNLIDNKIENDLSIIIKTITAIRNIKANLSIPPGQMIHIHIRGDKSETNIIENNLNLLNRIAKIEKINASENLKKPLQSATAVINKMEIFIPLKGLIDINKEIDRLNKQVEDMNGRLNAIYKKLNNPNFVDRAPKEVVAHEIKKKTNYEDTLKKLEDNLNTIME
jgi:valyl-tRNA synthetase